MASSTSLTTHTSTSKQTHDCAARGTGVVAGEPRMRYLHTHPSAAVDVADAWRELLNDQEQV